MINDIIKEFENEKFFIDTSNAICFRDGMCLEIDINKIMFYTVFEFLKKRKNRFGYNSVCILGNFKLKNNILNFDFTII